MPRGLWRGGERGDQTPAAFYKMEEEGWGGRGGESPCCSLADAAGCVEEHMPMIPFL